MLWFAEPTLHTMIAGGLVSLLGEMMRFWGVAYAGALTRVTGSVGAPELVVSGPFAYVRNPLYIGNILMYVGVAVMSNALVPWLAIAAGLYFTVQYRLIISLEEEFLAKEFPEPFDAYRKRVPRLMPRLTPYMPLLDKPQPPDWKGALRSERRTFQAIALIMAILLVLWYRG
jgi:protein-S-isoprenylcysteine O-methyltransferase Ste14